MHFLRKWYLVQTLALNFAFDKDKKGDLTGV